MNEAIPLIGEHIALDLVNTCTSAGDLLATSGDLKNWLNLETGRLPKVDPFAADLAAVREVREHTARALDRLRRGKRPAQTDLTALNDAQRAAPAINELTWRGSRVVAERSSTGATGAQLAALLAEAASELLSDPTVARIRQCAADDCTLLFLPAHPRRRWCSAARCGNRTRVARHYHRHKNH